MSITSKPNIKIIKNNLLMVIVDEDAPAYLPFTLNFKATMNDKILGPLGFITLLSNVTKTVNITLKSDYLGMISLFSPEGYDIETPPNIEKQLPIECTNQGNGKTISEFEVIENPLGFIVYFDPVNLTLDIDEKKITNLKIIAPNNFSGNETITISSTPHFYYNYSIVGHPEKTKINVFYNSP